MLYTIQLPCLPLSSDAFELVGVLGVWLNFATFGVSAIDADWFPLFGSFGVNDAGGDLTK